MKAKIVLLLLLLTAYCQLLTGTIRFVSKTGSSTLPYTSWATASDSIQKCINICQNGDTVYVANGVYKENLIINKEIALIGSSMDSTVIDGRGLRDTTIFTSAICSIENFNIYGKGAYLVSWAVWANDYLALSNCRITKTGVGVVILKRSSSVKNILMNELVIGYDAGCLSDTCTSYLDNCVILMNQNNRAVSIAIGGTYFIKNNIIIYNSPFNNPYFGIALNWPKKVYILNNLISGFQENISVDLLQDTAFIRNNIIMYKKRTNLNSQGSIDTENDNTIIINNIHANNTNTSVRGYPPFVKMNYNIFWNNENDLYGLNYGDRVADPMFVKDTIPSPQFNFDHHLQAFSPGIDKGDPSILDVDGSRSDIGLFGGPYGQIYTYHDLAPKPPRNLTASVQGKAVTLKWNKNTEADFFRYRVYRDTVPNFIYDTTKIIGVTADTFFVDMLGKKQEPNKYYYKLTAIDSAIHQSAASEEVQVTITGMAEVPPGV